MTSAPTPSATDVVSDFIAGAASEPCATEVRISAAAHVLDTVASIVACRDLEPARVARRYALSNSGTPSGTVILGTTDRASLVDAVFASAMAGHGAEVNDFMPSVFVQPGPAVVSTALTLAHQRGRSGSHLLQAVIAGYELAARIPRSVGAANLRRAGIASHGVAPVFGAGAAAASLLGFTADQVEHVLGACTQQASGSWQWLLDVEHIEKSFVFAGLGARNGLQAALLVEAGYRGVRQPLDQPRGWLRSSAFTGGDEDPTALTEGFDEPYAMFDTAYKRHPVGGPTQPAIEGLLELAETVPGDTVARVLIEMPGRAEAFRDAAMPALNLRYLTALILLDGRLDFEDAQSLDRMHGDERVVARMRDVEVRHDPRQETGTGRDRAESARLTLTLRDGCTVERFVPFVVGFPSHPMDLEQVEDKATALMAPLLGAHRAAAVVQACRDLARLPRVDDLVELIAR